MNPHKHKDLIIAWANGSPIQMKTYRGEWEDIPQPFWYPEVDYRIKPEPKPDTCVYASIYYPNDFGSTWDTLVLANTNRNKNRIRTGVIKLTHDGETGLLKSVEKINV